MQVGYSRAITSISHHITHVQIVHASLVQPPPSPSRSNDRSNRHTHTSEKESKFNETENERTNEMKAKCRIESEGKNNIVEEVRNWFVRP